MRQDGQSLFVRHADIIENADARLLESLTAGQTTIALIAVPVFPELLNLGFSFTGWTIHFSRLRVNNTSILRRLGNVKLFFGSDFLVNGQRWIVFGKRKHAFAK